MNGKGVITIAHALPVSLGSDGLLRVLLGERKYGRMAEKILIQPFGGKPNAGESLEDAGIREWREELIALGDKQLSEFFTPEKYLGVFTAKSDVNRNMTLKISCWWWRFLSQFPMQEKAGSEMQNPTWYTFSEILKHENAGTLTKLMVAVLGSKVYFQDDCIDYLVNADIGNYHPAVGKTIADTLAAVRETMDTEFSTVVDPRDTGLIQLLQRKGIGIDPLPKHVFFRGGKVSRAA